MVAHLKEFLTVEEVAKRVDKTGKTVRRWITDGSMPAIRIGGHWRVRAAVLEEYLASGGHGVVAFVRPAPAADPAPPEDPIESDATTAPAGAIPEGAEHV